MIVICSVLSLWPILHENSFHDLSFSDLVALYNPMEFYLVTIYRWC
jgi:hypothetical protein